MIVIRPISSGDFDEYVKLAFLAHINFYTLPKSERLLEERFERAIRSFSTHTATPDDELYLFVAEDTLAKKIVGVGGLSATSGGQDPLFFFRKEFVSVQSPLAPVVKKLPVLNPVSYLHGPSEVCSLFVDPLSRGTGVGKLLSLARFLFAARFPERFTGSFISELRGKLHDSSSPFWEAVGRHFFDASFHEVQQMLSFGHSFINHFLPPYPIYIDLLPEDVQATIGKVDEETQGAYSMLKRLGFSDTDEVDIIDGGPKVVAKKEQIVAISQSQVVTITKIGDVQSNGSHYILSNDRLDFRAVFAPVHVVANGSIIIGPDVASHLHVGLGDVIRTFNPKSM